MDEERNNVNEESRGLTFKDILFIIRKHWIAIICFIVACTAAGFIWSKVEPPVYSSTGSMLVSYESGSTTLTQDYTFSNYISSTYVSFIKESDIEPSLEVLNKAKGFIRSELASKLDTRRVPEIRFVLDEGYKVEERITELLKK